MFVLHTLVVVLLGQINHVYIGTQTDCTVLRHVVLSCALADGCQPHMKLASILCLQYTGDGGSMFL